MAAAPPELQRDAKIKLSVSSNRMEVRARWQPADLPADQVAALLRAQFDKLKLVWPSDAEALLAAIEAGRQRAMQSAADGPAAPDAAAPAAPVSAEQGSPTAEAVVAVGRPAGRTVDDVINWARDFFTTRFRIDEKTGRIDYRERADNQNVSPGDVVAMLVPGRQGAPGVDVFGKPTPARSVKPSTVRSGRNIRFDASNGTFTALCAGRLRLGDGLLAVDDVYAVPDSVGLASGNVQFPGHVSVSRDIEDGASVEADGGIDVGNVVGEAKVKAGGDMLIARGVAAKGKGKIVCAGGLCAGYLSGAELEAGGDVVVGREIVQSVVKTRGGVSVEGGRIVGGSVMALGEVVVAQAGSEAGVRTALTAGEDFALPIYLAKHQEELQALQARAAERQREIDRVTPHLRKLSPQQREVLTDMMYQLQEMELAIAQFRAKLDKRVLESEDAAVKRITILKVAHPGVTLRIAGTALAVSDTIKGPVRVVQDASGKKLELKRA